MHPLGAFIKLSLGSTAKRNCGGKRSILPFGLAIARLSITIPPPFMIHPHNTTQKVVIVIPGQVDLRLFIVHKCVKGRRQEERIGME